MKKIFLVILMCLISYNANAGMFTYLKASGANNAANKVLDSQEQLNDRLIRLENEIIQLKNEIIQLKNEIIENRKYLIVINERLKVNEKEVVKKPVSYPIIPNNELKNYTSKPDNYTIRY